MCEKEKMLITSIFSVKLPCRGSNWGTVIEINNNSTTPFFQNMPWVEDSLDFFPAQISVCKRKITLSIQNYFSKKGDNHCHHFLIRNINCSNLNTQVIVQKIRKQTMSVTIKKDIFGKTKDGRTVHSYRFEGSVIKVTVLDYGGAIQSIVVPDRDGKMADVCLGYDSVEGYETNTPYIGVLVGRVAGRITNGQFKIDGQDHQLDLNHGKHSIHGGWTGFSRRIWDASISGSSLKLTYVSPDGEEKFPGEMTTTVTYTLSPGGALTLEYNATCAQSSPINLTHHGYYNLAGHNADTILDHVVQITANRYVEVDPNNALVPTGEVLPVAESRLDFNKSTPLSKKEDAMKKGECDVTYDVDNHGRLRHISRVHHPASGRYVDTSTTAPGLQFYTAMFIKDVTGKGGKEYQAFASFCLETQNFPDAVNHSHFPDTILRPGETYQQMTQYVFGVM